MDADKLLPKIKIALRTTVDDDELDAEILGLINSGLADLEILGTVSKQFMDQQEYLITTAVTMYVKSLWGYDNPDAERQMNVYENIKTQLSIHSQFDLNGGDSNEI
ncbi:phage head-tail connector protein [Weissella tructae]|uniref:phage head-tail connector protein n=1 Tax=Weissella tructae TaxID=887702 RepID=UPI003D905B38